MTTVWVTGAGGFIGNAIVNASRTHAPDVNVIPLTRCDVDLTDFAEVVNNSAKTIRTSSSIAPRWRAVPIARPIHRSLEK
jgi:dTDP-4-dehydrorhamnose reductase